MSAQSGSASSPSPCACTNISLMQLFHELKQKFPGVPDHIVSNTIELYCHDKHACETHLYSEAKASLTHAYHASSSAAARQLNELKVEAPLKCRNQPIVKHDVPSPTTVLSIPCETPQTAILSLNTNEAEKLTTPSTSQDHLTNDVISENKVNIIDDYPENTNNRLNSPSPITINIDHCFEKQCSESPICAESDVFPSKHITQSTNESSITESQPGSINYKILKSNKIKSNLPEQLEKSKVKKIINKKEEPSIQESSAQDKPRRPCTLEFIKPNPEVAFKQHLSEPEFEPCRSVSPAPHHEKETHGKAGTPSGSYWPERGYPLNLSVNVNCHMDLSRARYSDPWLDDYESPHAITSVNLTVCTPTSAMESPVREKRSQDTHNNEDAFEGHVTVTVSPSATRPPRRRAPPPPPQAVEPQLLKTNAEPTPDRSLIERQRERLGRLAAALAQERARHVQLTRETAILAAPTPAQADALRLRNYVHRLRDHCNNMAKRLEMLGNEPESSDFYSNIYTGQRPPTTRRPTRTAPSPTLQSGDEAPPWQCHVCTFRNHGLLDKCEECEMPRILVGTSSQVRTIDSGFGSLSISESRRLSSRSTQLENNILLGSADSVRSERQVNSACV